MKELGNMLFSMRNLDQDPFEVHKVLKKQKEFRNLKEERSGVKKMWMIMLCYDPATAFVVGTQVPEKWNMAADLLGLEHSTVRKWQKTPSIMEAKSAFLYILWKPKWERMMMIQEVSYLARKNIMIKAAEMTASQASDAISFLKQDYDEIDALLQEEKRIFAGFSGEKEVMGKARDMLQSKYSQESTVDSIINQVHSRPAW